VQPKVTLTPMMVTVVRENPVDEALSEIQWDHDAVSDRFKDLQDHLKEFHSSAQISVVDVFAEACKFLSVDQHPISSLLIDEAPSLHLGHCYLSRLHVLALAASVHHRTWTTSVVFGPQSLDSSALSILCRGLSALPHLTSLDVAQNPIGSLGVMGLVRLARQCPSLKSINIDGVEVVPAVHRKLGRILASR
jgi:hypothetical protein